ncbi:LCP family protein [Calderihabitans maritimus]|uniref:Cell envelope-related transcriptional attenuator n=1 Tax=Calderihabitans maritimus TaxID=1246530 RepID=A0A1Z5HWE1_9FIRM|nr:LCP family protein [Calderihabitans maritimus]GAW93852.1 cell envelope-related transcriptional attenuator [Calderihabitans maritimus]
MSGYWKKVFGWYLAGILFIIAFYLGLSGYINSREIPSGEEDFPPQTEEPGLPPINVLILGLDTRENQKEPGRTDAIMVARIDPEKPGIYLVSIPRDTRVKIKGSWDKINAAYVYGGIDLARRTVEEFLDITIDHYVIVDFRGFVRLVDLVGGIDLEVPVRMYYPPEGIDLQPGYQTLNGEDTLAYARYRYTKEGDIGRAKRQQQVLELLLRKLLRLQSLSKLPGMIKIAREYVETDLSAQTLTQLGRVAYRVKDVPVTTVVIPGKNLKIDGLWYWEPDRGKVREIARLLR